MKNILVTVILFGSLQAIAWAKDKPADPPPSWTLEQKLAYVTAQRDAAYKIIQASPQECAAMQGQNAVISLAAEYNKGIDMAKWKQNPQTLEFEAVPQPKPDEKKPEEVTPETK